MRHQALARWRSALLPLTLSVQLLDMEPRVELRHVGVLRHPAGAEHDLVRVRVRVRVRLRLRLRLRLSGDSEAEAEDVSEAEAEAE